MNVALMTAPISSIVSGLRRPRSRARPSSPMTARTDPPKEAMGRNVLARRALVPKRVVQVMAPSPAPPESPRM